MRLLAGGFGVPGLERRLGRGALKRVGYSRRAWGVAGGGRLGEVDRHGYCKPYVGASSHFSQFRSVSSCAWSVHGCVAPCSLVSSVIQCVVPVSFACTPDGSEVSISPIVSTPHDLLYCRCAHEYGSTFASSLSGPFVQIHDGIVVTFPYFPLLLVSS